MKYKLLLLDIDGTLTKPAGDALPSIRVIAAVKEAQKHLTIAIATGRPEELTRGVVEALGLHGFGIFNGGAEVINTTTQKTEIEQLLSISQLRELVKLAVPFGYGTYTDDDQYGARVTSSDEITAAAAKLFIEAVATHDVPAILEELNSVTGAIAHPTVSWEKGDVMDIHINHALATKRHGAERLMKLLGYKKSEVIAIGDGHNDVPLLEAAGLKIAMGNAPTEVKAVADYVAPSLDDDGVAEAIERFILN